MLVIFKSPPILRKLLRIKQPMLQLYSLKLLKMQARHLGRQWRKTNMSIMSAIYQKVRHRLNDDWAFANEQDGQGWDFQSDEGALRAKIDTFNQRKFKLPHPRHNQQPQPQQQTQQSLNEDAQQPLPSTTNTGPSATSTATTASSSLFSYLDDYTPTDNSLLSNLNKSISLPDDFENNYEKWLEEEVFTSSIEWDKLISDTHATAAEAALATLNANAAIAAVAANDRHNKLIVY
jgi:hypothetical protein